jgi:hypothetical protein
MHIDIPIPPHTKSRQRGRRISGGRSEIRIDLNIPLRTTGSIVSRIEPLHAQPLVRDEIIVAVQAEIPCASGILHLTNRITDDKKAITINGKSVNIPSCLVKTGDVIAVREKSKKQNRVGEALQLAQQVGLPAWVDVNAEKAEGVFKKVPDRDEFAADINESLIVELYSR